MAGNNNDRLAPSASAAAVVAADNINSIGAVDRGRSTPPPMATAPTRAPSSAPIVAATTASTAVSGGEDYHYEVAHPPPIRRNAPASHYRAAAPSPSIMRAPSATDAASPIPADPRLHMMVSSATPHTPSYVGHSPASPGGNNNDESHHHHHGPTRGSQRRTAPAVPSSRASSNGSVASLPTLASTRYTMNTTVSSNGAGVAVVGSGGRVLRSAVPMPPSAPPTARRRRPSIVGSSPLADSNHGAAAYQFPPPPTP